MIERAKTVEIRTAGGYRRRITVMDSVMTTKSLRKILKRFGGEEKEQYYWFEDRKRYNDVIKKLCDEGAFVN
ncbi:MAG: hypothetical protein HFJ49_04160 [Clostridia bacterium]|nr:hypothetical protein [Clostridia bacterium]